MQVNLNLYDQNNHKQHFGSIVDRSGNAMFSRIKNPEQYEAVTELMHTMDNSRLYAEIHRFNEGCNRLTAIIRDAFNNKYTLYEPYFDSLLKRSPVKFVKNLCQEMKNIEMKS